MRSLATKSSCLSLRVYTSRTFPLVRAPRSWKSVCKRTESRSSELMMKFYRQEARRILACQKKLSTILITSVRSFLECGRQKNVDRNHGCLKTHAPLSLMTSGSCGKAEDGRGYLGRKLLSLF